MFKQPSLSFDQANENFHRHLKKGSDKMVQDRTFENKKEKEDLIYWFKWEIFNKLDKLLYIASHSNYIPLDNPIYDWDMLAIHRYGSRVGNWLIGELRYEARENEDPCKSNFTFCELGNAQEEQDYRETQDCCGRAEYMRKNWLTGRTFLMGYNYGH